MLLLLWCSPPDVFDVLFFHIRIFLFLGIAVVGFMHFVCQVCRFWWSFGFFFVRFVFRCSNYAPPFTLWVLCTLNVFVATFVVSTLRIGWSFVLQLRCWRLFLMLWFVGDSCVGVVVSSQVLVCVVDNVKRMNCCSFRRLRAQPLLLAGLCYQFLSFPL